MDHSDNDKRFCVYYLRCVNTNNVFYIGHGNINRPYVKSSRSSKVTEYMNNNEFLVQIYKENLSKSEAIELENVLLDKYLNKEVDGFALLNIYNGYKTKPIVYEEMSKIFEYDKTSPTFLRWKVDRFGTGKAKIVKAGDVAGNVGNAEKKRYAAVSINYKMYQVHRIIYCLCNKTDVPQNLVVDHIDGDVTNNSIANLRLVTVSGNMQNVNRCKLQSNNKSGANGIHFLKTEYNRYWTANVNIDVKKRKSKSFNIDKYGYDEAYRLACEWRKQMEELYYNKPEQ